MRTGSDPWPRAWCSSRSPGRMAYGGMDAVFDDTCGNLINLHQD
jgi:hypothetical protein